MNSRLIAITGPTASGKSRLALELSRQCDGWVINADSQQILEELPILTDQPEKSPRYFLYGHKKHTDYYSSFQWCCEAEEMMLAALAHGKVPILVGGTGFYFNNFLNGHFKSTNTSERVFFVRGVEVFKILINPPKKELEEKCRIRIKEMFPAVIQEVQTCPDQLRLRKVIGFSEIKDGENMQVIQEKMLIRTRQYIKRQKTWFKKYCADWYEYEDYRSSKIWLDLKAWNLLHHIV